MIPYNSGDASKQFKEMIFYNKKVKKIIKKAKKLEKSYEKAIECGANVKAARIRRSYMNLADKFPGVVK